MSVLPVGFGSAVAGGGGYQIQRSLRFNSADSAYLNRTPASSGSRTTWTLSGWVKRGALGVNHAIISCGSYSTDLFQVYFEDVTNSISIQNFPNSTTANVRLLTTAVYRDLSAWYHIVVVMDTTQATSSNRVKLYVNGVQVTVFSTATYPAQNATPNWNTGSLAHFIGARNSTTLLYSGYITEVNFIDGLTPNTTTRTVNGVTETILTELGQFNANTGVWEPAAWTRAFGTNGFYLNFSDNSNNTAATLGKDYSGNGNNWTPNNFSVTAGAGNDSMVDSPTSYGTDTGVGGEVRGNYATMNPLITGNVISPSNGNLDVVLAAGSNAYFSSVGTIAIPSGKWYWECVITARDVSAGQWLQFGIVSSTTTYTNNAIGYSGNMSAAYAYYNDGGKAGNGTGTAGYGATFTTNDVIGVAFDDDAGTITFYKNGVSQGQAFSGISTSLSWYPIIQIYRSAGTNQSATINFGQRPFEKWNGSAFVANTAPSGFKALCTQNFTTPTIGATSTTQANKYMDVTLYTGNGAVRSITNGGSMQPDFVWDKLRSGINSHRLFDAVRGVEKVLYSNLTNAEATETGTLTSFNSNGFSLGTNTETNTNGSTYVAWQWKANGAGSTNSNGTAKSSSVTVDSGTDTVTWNSHGMSDGQKIGFFAATMPGGLSAGTLYYVRDAATNTFKVAASSGGAAIDITSNGTTVTAHTTLTSTVSANTASGFSIVTYTGTGANATVEHGLGKAPSFIIVKSRSIVDGWLVYSSILGATKYLVLSSSNAQGTLTAAWNDTAPTSTVFSLGTNAAVNQNSATYVAYCFAEVAGYSAFGSYTGDGSADGPFVYLGFRPAYVLIKRSSATEVWCVMDSKREGYNVDNDPLFANLTNTEGTQDFLDLLSNGFKLRSTDTGVNGSGTYIYAAFAETPFKYSLAR